MNTPRLLSLVATIVALSPSLGAPAAPDPVQAVSLTDPHVARSASPAGDSLGSTISPDGSFVVFMSNAGNLVSNDSQGLVIDVFHRTRTNDVPTLVTVNAGGTGGGNSNSVVSSFTPDGRYVAFVSAASDLVAGDINGLPDVFVRDLPTGTTTLVSVGAQAVFSGSASPVISSNGQWVAFTSTASNLVAGVTNRNSEVYVRDRSAGTVLWASSNILAGFADAFGAIQLIRPTSYSPVLSDDGRWLSFKTSSSYTADTATNSTGACVIFRLDLQTEAMEVVCTNAEPGTVGFPDASGPVMTPDGRFIAYTTGDSTNAPRNVFRWDAQTGATVPVSVNLSGILSTNGMSDTPAVSPDGRYFSFVSDATDLVTNVVNGEFQVYVRDLLSGTTRLASADAAGAASGDASVAIPTLSNDGRFVAFDSPSDRHLAADRNRAHDAFVRDTVAGTTELVSSAAAGLDAFTGVGFSSVGANCVSADGRWVVFTSLGDDLVAGHTNGYQDVYARDLQTGTNLLVSVGADGASANGSSSSPMISANGRYVAFVSAATNLVVGDTNQLEDVFVRDLLASTTELVSVNAAGTGSGDGRSLAPSLSAEGRRVAFQSAASDLAPNDLDTLDDVFVRNLDAGTTTLASGEVPGASATTSFLAPLLSPDGRFVAFGSSSAVHKLLVKDVAGGTLIDFGTTNFLGSAAISGDSRWLVFGYGTGSTSGQLGLMFQDLLGQTQRQVVFDPLVAGDLNDEKDVFLHDRLSGQTTLISAGPIGLGFASERSSHPVLNADGNRVVFRSLASELVAGDFNATQDVFAYLFTPVVVVVDPHPVFECDALVTGDGATEVSWKAAPGRAYRVQFKDDLGAPVWSELAGTVGILGSRARISDATAGGVRQRFYRVALVE